MARDSRHFFKDKSSFEDLDERDGNRERDWVDNKENACSWDALSAGWGWRLLGSGEEEMDLRPISLVHFIYLFI